MRTISAAVPIAAAIVASTPLGFGPDRRFSAIEGVAVQRAKQSLDQARQDRPRSAGAVAPLSESTRSASKTRYGESRRLGQELEHRLQVGAVLGGEKVWLSRSRYAPQKCS